MHLVNFKYMLKTPSLKYMALHYSGKGRNGSLVLKKKINSIIHRGAFKHHHLVEPVNLEDESL